MVRLTRPARREPRSKPATRDHPARDSGSPSVEAEHVLLAISALEGTAAQRLLASAGLDHPAIKLALKQEVRQSLSAAGITIDPDQRSILTNSRPRSIDPSRPLRLGASARMTIERAAKASTGARQIHPHLLLIGVPEAQAGTVRGGVGVPLVGGWLVVW